MQSLRFFIMLFLCVGSLLTGCRRTSSARLQLLERAEAIVEENPDSALSLLSALPDAATLSPSERALRGLVLTRALDKTYCDVDDDSIIAPAAEFFRGSSETRRHMMAAFCHGRVKANAADYPAALSLFTEARELANNIGDQFWSARASAEIASVFAELFHGPEELIYSKEALAGFKAAGSQPFENYALLAVARAYHNVDKYEAAMALCSQLLDSAEVYNDAILHREAERQLAFSSFYAGEYDRSISIYRKLYEAEPDNRETRAMLGKSYLAIGRLDSAGMLMTESESNASVAEMTLSYGVFKQRGELARALTSLEAVLRTSDRKLSESLDQAFLQTLVDYYKAKEDVRVLELHTARLTRTIVIVIAIVIGLVLVIAILILYRRIRRARERHAIEIAALNDEISRHESVIQQRQDRLFSLASSKFAAVDRLCQVYYENQVCKNLSEKLSDAMDGMIALFSDEESMLAELGELLDQAFDNVFSRFVSDFPKVKKADKLIFIFAAFHVSAGAASLYLKKNKKEYIYNHRKRLKAKIAESNSPYRAEYLAILG